MNIGGIAKQMFGVTRREGSEAIAAKAGKAISSEVSSVAKNVDKLVIRPGADLRGAYLKDANLPGVDLSGAKLKFANLSGADLSGAKLPGADLRRADLSVARLPGAVLSEADLSGAKLRDAKLRDADLSGAKLPGADLRRADLGGAKLRDADLSGADLGGANLPDLRFTRIKGATVVNPHSGREIELRNFEDLPSQVRKANGQHPWRNQAI